MAIDSRKGSQEDVAVNRNIAIQIELRLAEFQWFGRHFFLTASYCLRSLMPLRKFDNLRRYLNKKRKSLHDFMFPMGK